MFMKHKKLALFARQYPNTSHPDILTNDKRGLKYLLS